MKNPDITVSVLPEYIRVKQLEFVFSKTLNLCYVLKHHIILFVVQLTLLIVFVSN